MNTKKLYNGITAALIFSMVSTAAMCQNSPSKIDYKSFTVSAVQKKIIIDWVIDNSAVANYFEIQRSDDGKNFRTVAMVMGPDPKQSAGDSYEGFDKPGANTKKYFYRLKHVGTDGEIELSETKAVAFN
jgi:hypothetical protein